MSWYEELDRWTADYLPDMIYEHDAALAKYTSFRIGGPARRMAFPKDGSQMVLSSRRRGAVGPDHWSSATARTCCFPTRVWTGWW